MSDLVIPRKKKFYGNFFPSLPLGAIEETAEVFVSNGDKDFSGFLVASELAKSLETYPSASLSMTVENELHGKIDQLPEVDRPQIELEEPQANSTLLEPVDVTAAPADSDTEAEKEGPRPSTPKVDMRERKRARRRQYRQRRALTGSLSNLST